MQMTVIVITHPGVDPVQLVAHAEFVQQIKQRLIGTADKVVIALNTEAVEVKMG